MKISSSWLKDYVKFESSLDEVAHALTMSGNEVENIRSIGNIDKVVVAKVIEIRPHPDADKLQLVLVDNGTSVLEVVCGAKNLFIGQKVAFASVGAKLFNPHSEDFEEVFTLKKSKIRGVISEGMICSEKELGIGGDHTGILNLESDAVIGTKIEDLIGDSILEFSLTPNRSDCLGIIGIAREVSAILDVKLKLPDTNYISSKNEVNSAISVNIEATDLCHRYMGSVITGVSIKPSPKWLQDRLTAIGERPINNIVDITNYIMFETGQPLHAFDYEKIKDKKIIVRRAKNKEKITSLDNTVRELDSNILVISDSEKPIGIAGVMGGKNSEITSKTTNIFLEAATFDSSNNRKTSKELNLKSEANLRFEKGLNPQLAEFAIKRAIKMILEVSGGESYSGLIDEPKEKIISKKNILINKNYLDNILGLKLDDFVIEDSLKKLGFEIVNYNEKWDITVPYWREDVNIPEDIVEEIARIVGYDIFPSKTISDHLPIWSPTEDLDLKRKVTDYLVESGMQEIISYSATNIESESRLFFPENHPSPVFIRNPISNDFNIMRRTLRESILNCVSYNIRSWKDPIAIFELGRIFLETNDDLPKEKIMINGAFAGPRNSIYWEGKLNETFDFFDAKGSVEYLLKKLKIPIKFSKFSDDPTFISGRCAKILSGKKLDIEIGVLGQISDEIISKFDSNIPEIFMFEIDFESLLNIYIDFDKYNFYSPFSRHQNSQRDISLVVDDFQEAQEIIDIVNKQNIVLRSEIINIYSGEDIVDGKKVVTVRIEYQSFDKTLKASEISKIEKKILLNLKKSIGADLRS